MIDDGACRVVAAHRRAAVIALSTATLARLLTGIAVDLLALAWW